MVELSMMRTYAGPVYDGPWEGRQIEKMRPYFKIAIAPQFGFGREPLINPSDIREYFYRWSPPLRKWVFDPSIR